MLTPVQRRKFSAADARFAIVASKYNGRYVGAMVRAAQAEFKRAGVRHVRIVRVPGAYEIPIVAARLAELKAAGDADEFRGLSGIVCLGVILRGETVHAAHIGEAVSRALMELQLAYKLPLIHEVLLLENRAQAEARCLSRRHNRGAEAAQTALAMAEVMQSLRS